jgi:formylglycine-generating enzyme required for sulfatase activity
MKYELTQRQYADFLNLLTFDQQTARTGASPGSPAGSRAMADSMRNGIEVKMPGAPGTPAVYGNDFSDDGFYDQLDDGQDLPCTSVSAADGMAYADWAGLRPLTELEYEKAGRGTASPVPGEYAWGSAQMVGDGDATFTYVLAAPGSPSEQVTNPVTGVGNVANRYTATSRPLRVGIFAASLGAPGRAEAGASYYGVMELTGNVAERTVNVNAPAARAFTGTPGDGNLTTTGDADAPAWPTFRRSFALRGGTCITDDLLGDVRALPLSSRLFAVEAGLGSNPRWSGASMRSARSAP